MHLDNHNATRNPSARPVLQALRTHGPLTLRQLQEWTGFSHTTVTAGVNMLRDMGLADDGGVLRSVGLGRPSTLWQLRPDAACVVGMDVGATTVRLTVLDMTGQVVQSYHEETADLYSRAPGGVAVARELAALVHRTANSSPQPVIRPVALGVAISGLIDAERGICLSCTNIAGWQDLHIVAELCVCQGKTRPFDTLKVGHVITRPSSACHTKSDCRLSTGIRAVPAPRNIPAVS